MDEEGLFVSSLRSTPHKRFFPDSVKSSFGRIDAWGDSKISDSGPIHNNTSDNMWGGETRNRWDRISQLFSVRDQNSNPPRVIGQRASYGFGMASAYANALRAENAWSTSKANPHQITQISLSKALPSLPHERPVTGGDLSSAGMLGRFEPIEMRRYNTTRSCGERTKLECSEEVADITRKDNASLNEALFKLKRFRSQNREFNVTPEKKQKATSLADIPSGKSAQLWC
jgi:hypothetical protein